METCSCLIPAEPVSRSQEQRACLSQVVLLPHNQWSGVSPLQSSSICICSCRWRPISISRSRCMQCGVATLLCRCRPAQSDRREEMKSCRRAEHHHHHDRPGQASPTTPRRGPMRQHSTFMGRRRASSAATVMVLWSARGR